MEKQFILHMLTTEKNLSPFDVIMALDAGWMSAVPYTNVKPDEVQGLIHDAIFARSIKALKKIGFFIGGKDVKQALALLSLTKKSMMPPFTASVLADPSGAFTLAASIIAFIELQLQKVFNTQLAEKAILIIGDTNPVSQVAAILLAKAGARVTIICRDLEKAQYTAKICNQELGEVPHHISAAHVSDKVSLIKQADIILSKAASGVQTISKQMLMTAENLKICADVNPVPPYGIEGINPHQQNQPIPNCKTNAIGVGALVRATALKLD